LFAVLETMPIMISLMTPNYHVAFANRSFREAFGGNRLIDPNPQNYIDLLRRD
jgi:PAS domain-containing protein